jgi:hypothetical protein
MLPLSPLVVSTLKLSSILEGVVVLLVLFRTELTIQCSSDFFLAKTGFECFDLADNPVPEADCFFGTPGFDTTKSRTFRPFPNMNFNISFADLEFLTGEVGFDTITVGGLTVTHQEFGVITKAAWNGDGVTTGLMGLAFPGLTSVFNGSNPDADSAANIAQYNPLFFTAVQQKLVAPCKPSNALLISM